jgi:ADP-heptose:LPS heptosyltransferase
MGEVGRLGAPLPVKIAVVRALRGLGDMLCIVPALRALRTALPDAHVTLVGLPWAASFVQRFHLYLDDLLEFPGFPGIPEAPLNIAALPAFFEETHRRGFDLALQMQGSGLTSNPFTVMLGARRSAGLYLPGLYCPDPDLCMPLPADQPEVRRFLLLMAHIGIPPQGEQLEFPLTGDDYAAFDAISEARSLAEGQYIVVHPGAFDEQRRWAPEKFARVADRLSRQRLQVVLTGTAAEADAADAVAQCMRTRALNLAGRTSLGAMAVLLSRARLLVGNDTGTSHLAAALRVPSVIVFLHSNPARWAPLDRRLHRVVGQPGLGRMDEVPVALRAADMGDGDGPFADLFTLSGRCLRDGCMRSHPVELLEPVEATTERVLAEAHDLLRPPSQAIPEAAAHVG